MRRILAIFLACAAILTGSAFALEEEQREEAAAAAAREAIAACVQEDMTDLETLTVLHDWLALHCDYGATKQGETAYGTLVEHTGNCVGYAEGYACLTAQAGLEGVSTYSESLDHAWILVTLEGERYFSDSTWDDGKYQKLGLIRHRYFLFDDLNAAQLGHFGWDSEERVPGGELENAPWIDAVTRVIFTGDYAYYIDGGFCLRRCDRESWETELLWQTDARWADADPEDGKEPELYTSLVYFGGRLFFNTAAAVCSIDTEGRELRVVTEPELPEGLQIYGIAVRDGLFVYSVAEGPDAILYDIVPIAPVKTCWGE